MKNLIALFVTLTLLGCSQSGNPPAREEYFSLRELINDQIRVLSSGNYQLEKSAALNDKSDSRLLTLDSTEWRDELKLFLDADINVPSLQGVYIENEGPGETNSNLIEVNYYPSTRVEIGVQYLKIFYVDDLSDPRKIELKTAEVNPLFDSETFMSLRLIRDGNDNLVLKSYEISGGQKMILLDSASYTIKGEVIKL